MFKVKQMFDVSEKLVPKQSDETQLIGKTLHGSICLRLVMNWSSVFRAQKSTCFQIVYCVVVRSRSNIAWENRLKWFKSSPEYRALDRIDGESMEFEWNIFQGFTALQHSHKVQDFQLRLGDIPENFYRTNYLHVDVQRHLMEIERQQERIRIKCSIRFSICK